MTSGQKVDFINVMFIGISNVTIGLESLITEMYGMGWGTNLDLKNNM